MTRKRFFFILLLLICPTLLHANDSLRFKIGKMLIIGFRGTELNAKNHICIDIQKHHIAGVILFDYDAPSKKRGRNITDPIQLKRLCAALQSLSNEKLFITIDQEGGRVSRLKQSLGFEHTVTAKFLGELDNLDTTRWYAQKTAKQLKYLGFNLNFAPCVDLNVNSNCPIIGKVERSFSNNPNIVVKHSRVWIEEHRKLGIYTALKHFPGHGSSSSDSHLGFTDVSDTWDAKELTPYKELITSGYCDMIMVSHVFNKNLDSNFPATLSHKMIDGIIRQKLEYKGLVVTDDMAMGAIVDHYSLEIALEKAVNAGADMLILSNNGKLYDAQITSKAIDIIYNLVLQKRIAVSRINSAYERVKRMKSLL
ncbi:MAG: glycoside hydrolase family 3 protein [Bacteroidales bacterium]